MGRYEYDSCLGNANHPFSIGIRNEIPDNYKIDLLTAFTAALGNYSSLDYVREKYYNYFKDTISKKTEYDDQLLIALEIINVANQLLKLSNSKVYGKAAKPESIGLIAASLALTRSLSTFEIASALARDGYTYEFMAIAKLILEQVSWAIEVYEKDTQEVFSGSTTKSISVYSKINPVVGKLYGYLNKYAHISPAESRRYVIAKSCSNNLNALAHSYVDSPFLSLVYFELADMYSIALEIVCHLMVDNLELISTESGSVRINDNRPAIKHKLQYKEKLIVLIDGNLILREELWKILEI